MYIYMYMYMCICIYIYIYVYMYISKEESNTTVQKFFYMQSLFQDK